MEQETVTKGNLEGKRKKAKEGDMVEVKRGRYKGKKGEVLIVKENSVIIQLGINPKTGEPVKRLSIIKTING